MALPVRKKREVIFQLLYSHNFLEVDKEYFVPFLMNEVKTTRKNILIILDYFSNLLKNIEKIDSKIQKHSTSYDFSRISKVELSILRLAINESLFDLLPIKIAISEAIRLTKKYTNAKSLSFINAVLDSIHKNENTEK